MSPEKQRIAIAEACGWTDIPIVNGKYGQTDLPDYCNDLNAMHGAEKTRTHGELLRMAKQTMELGQCCPYVATARQRAEVFLRTIGKWEDSQ